MLPGLKKTSFGIVAARNQQPSAASFPTGKAWCQSGHAWRHASVQVLLQYSSVSKAKTGSPVVRAVPNRGAIDVVGFGNLCVDAVLPLEQLPPADRNVRRELLDQLTASPPDPSSWEVGGNCNFMVAAARLGLRVASVGHIGGDVYGTFMDEVLKAEGVQATTRIAAPPPPTSPHTHSTTSGSAATAATGGSTALAARPAAPSSRSGGGGGSGSDCLDSTLICFVLVDPSSGHAFCSRYDFGPWPLLEAITALPQEAMQVLRASRAIFTNGFIFDELPLAAVQTACADAIKQGSAIFFDPGPRCQTMLEGPRRAALDMLMDMSEVILMTEEEARVVTGLVDPEAAARAVLRRPGARARWAVVKMGGEGALLCEWRQRGSGNGATHNNGNGHGVVQIDAVCGEEDIVATRMSGVKVEVVDTVGCGDSFAAAIVMGYIHGWPADVTLALGNAVGAATATGRGAGRNVARRGDVMRLLAAGAARGGAVGGAFDRARELLEGIAEGRSQQDSRVSAAA